jgi:hypothetical protein
LRKVAVVREYQQAVTLGVEPTDVRERRKFRREQVVNRIGYVRIASRADEASWFVEQKVNMRVLTNELAIDFDVIGWGWLEMKIPARFSIHRHTTTGDQFVGTTT